MILILQFSFLFCFSILTLSLVKSKTIRIALTLFFTLFITAQFNSVILGGGLIDYKFYQHLNIETIWAVKSIFIIQIFKICIFSGMAYYVYHYISSHNFFTELNFFVKSTGSLLSFSLMCLNGGMVYNIYEIFSLSNTKVKTNFEQSMSLISEGNNSYVSNENFKIEPVTDTLSKLNTHKNIIVISMESLEKGYLGDNLAHLTPNMRNMAKDMTIFNMEMGSGSDWTAGSIYTELTGFPCFFKKQGNDIFQSVIGTKIIGLGHILDKAGYDLTYIMAFANFAGVRDMLYANKFKVISEGNFSAGASVGQWGTHDKDVFFELKKRIKNSKTKSKPFAMFMSTIGTHPPDGVYDKRMENLVPKQKTDLEFMVAATDYHIGDLMKFLKKENLLENTVVYLFPDHLLMGTGIESDVINRFPNPRSLFLITNAPKNKFSYSTTKNIYQIDIPKIILQGAEVRHNAKFFTDYIKDNDKLNYIVNHKVDILTINESSLIYRNNKLLLKQQLVKGNKIFSPNKKYFLYLQFDGNLVVYDSNYLPIWATNSDGTTASILEFNKDGNLVLRDKKNKIYWSSNSKSNGERLEIEDDGALRLYGKNRIEVWSSVNVINHPTNK